MGRKNNGIAVCFPNIDLKADFFEAACRPFGGFTDIVLIGRICADGRNF
jgi:hypothetical protein